MTKCEAIAQIKWYFEEDDGIAAEGITKEAANMAIKALEEPTLTTVGEPIFVTGTSIEPYWHSYPAEKPDKEGEYLVTETSCIKSDILFVSIEYYSGDNWTDEDGGGVWDISQYIRAWMSLPKPYETEKIDANKEN